MRLLSIDLPWGHERFVGLAWTDTGEQKGPIRTALLRGVGRLEEARDWEPVRACVGEACDVLLLDQPIGMTAEEVPPTAKACRPVELAWGNRFFCPGPRGSKIQFPRFQPGNEHAARGILRARAALEAVGSATSVAVECFPQLVVPVLLAAARTGAPADAITSLAAHKPRTPRAQRLRAQEQLRTLIERFTGRALDWPQWLALGQPGASDVLDAALGLVTGLGLARALPPGAPSAVRLTQPRPPFRLPRTREEATVVGGGWWEPTTDWLDSSRPVVRTNGVAALRWW